MIEVHVSDDVSKRRFSELFDSIGKVRNFVHRLERIGDLVVKDRVDFDYDVIFRNNVLLREVVNGLAQIDEGLLRRDHDLSAVVELFHHSCFHSARLVDDRNDDVETALKRAVILSEPFNDDDFRLRNDFRSFCDDDYCKNAENSDYPNHVFPPTDVILL